MSKKKSKLNLKNPRLLLLIAAVLVVVLVVLLVFALKGDETPSSIKPTGELQIDKVDAVSVDLGNGLKIKEIGRYAGIYMEDGSDEIVSDVLMLLVANEGEKALQYTEISIPVGDKTAVFSLSTLMPGESVVVLEKNRMAYSDRADPKAFTLENTIFFQETPSLYAEQLQLQLLDGALNVTNISDADITGDIWIYYKNAAADVYYGGITYRAGIKGGLKAGEICQLTSPRFSDTGCEIVFITVVNADA